MNRNIKSGITQKSDILTAKATYRLPFANDTRHFSDLIPPIYLSETATLVTSHRSMHMFISNDVNVCIERYECSHRTK